MQVETRQRPILWVRSQIWVLRHCQRLKKEDFYEDAGARTAAALVLAVVAVVVVTVVRSCCVLNYR